MKTLKSRSDFVRAARSGQKCIKKSVVVQRRVHQHGCVRVGFTATKKLGGAVVRNRVKRRLRCAFREAFQPVAGESCDYVLIGRAQTSACRYASILDDVKSALINLRQLQPRNARGKKR